MNLNNLDIKKMLNEKGITQIEIAECLDVTHEYICRLLGKPNLEESKRNMILNAISKIEAQKAS